MLSSFTVSFPIDPLGLVQKIYIPKMNSKAMK